MANAEKTTGKNNMNKFLIATKESSKPEMLPKSNGTNTINIIPNINEITANSLESLSTLNPDNPNFLAYHPVIDITEHTIKVRIAGIVTFSLKTIISPAIEVREKIIIVNHAHILMIVASIIYCI
jgi:hypothetical protein